MTISAATVRTLEDDSFLIKMAEGLGSIAIHVSVPKTDNDNGGGHPSTSMSRPDGYASGNRQHYPMVMQR
jgi:hypothetical protein